MTRRTLVLVAVAGLLTPLAHGADWPTPQQNNRRTGYSAERIVPPFKEIWRHDFGEMIDVRVQPIVAEGLVLVPTYKGKLHALDAVTGEPRWVFRTDGPIFSSPSAADGKAYVSCQDRNVYCVDMKSGKELWRFTTGEGVWATPAVKGDLVYIGSRDGVFYALGAADGKEKWRHETGAPIETTAAVSGDTVYFGCENLYAYALNRHTGKELWKAKTIGQSMRSYWPVVSDKYVYFRTLPVRSWVQHSFNVGLDMSNSDRLARVEAWLKKDPFSQTFFAMDPATGEQAIFPVLWTAGGGTVPYPPVVLPDGRIVTPAPSGERTSSSGSTSVSVLDETTRQGPNGYIRVIGDESYGYSVAGTTLFSSHHDYLHCIDLTRAPSGGRNAMTLLGRRDRPVDLNAAQWFGNHDNHPGWHAASLADGRVYWINQGSWLFVFEGRVR